MDVGSFDRMLDDPRTDDKIRNALRDADSRGKLSVVAAVIGIAGGVESVREIMESEGPLCVMDRGMFAIHLGIL